MQQGKRSGQWANFEAPALLQVSHWIRAHTDSELARLFGIVTILDAVCQFHGIEAGWIKLACNGLSALKQATMDSDTISPKYPQFDLILAICKAIQLSPLDWIFCHVKGHHDDCTCRA